MILQMDQPRHREARNFLKVTQLAGGQPDLSPHVLQFQSLAFPQYTDEADLGFYFRNSGDPELST